MSKFSETMTVFQFDLQMTRIFDEFGSKSYSEERKVMIWNVAQRMPLEGFEKVVSTLIATQKSPPLPSVFIEAINSEMRRWTRIRHEVIDVEPTRCLTCNDLGIIRIQSLFAEESIDELMRCNCVEGKKQVWNLPMWVHEIHSKLFSRSHCPIEWFKDSVIRSGSDKWNQRIYKSQRYFSYEEGLRKGKE